jgi:hypothetical protein
MKNSAEDLRKRNPFVTQGSTIIETDTQRSKTNSSNVRRYRWNDLPYNESVLVFDTVDEVRNLTVPYMKDQVLFVKSSAVQLFYDSTDSTSQDNGGSIVVDQLGRRFKAISDSSSIFTDGYEITT